MHAFVVSGLIKRRAELAGEIGLYTHSYEPSPSREARSEPRLARRTSIAAVPAARPETPSALSRPRCVNPALV